jgi:hypothetical protein
MTNGKLNAKNWKNNSGRSCKVTLNMGVGKNRFLGGENLAGTCGFTW